MKLSAKTGVALTITALSLVVTVGAGASDSVEPVDAWVIHCCTAYSEAAPTPSTSVTPVDARVISCCTAYSEDIPVPSTSVTVGAGASDSVEPVDAWVMHCCTAYSEDVPSVTPLPTFLVTPLATSAAHVGMMNQLRNLTEANAIKWGWSQGLANDQASAGMTR